MHGKGWKTAVVLIILAIVLNLSLTRWDTDRVVTRVDAPRGYSVTHTIRAAPLQIWFFSVADLACPRTPCTAAVASVDGLYARGGVPGTLAVVLGIVLPDILVVAALYLLLDRMPGGWRKGVGATVGLFGFLVVVPYGALFLSQLSGPEGVPRGPVLAAIPWLVALTGFALAGIGTRAVFTRRHATQ